MKSMSGGSARSRGSSCSSSRFKAVDGELPKSCSCGYKWSQQTSLTKKNPVRRFVACPVRDETSCKEFFWTDDPIPPRTMQIINELESEARTMDGQFKLYKLRL
ncbi:hypothetical protein BUALT_Bualt06G0012600 [Buddleja alternifolia]|uniref:GRF-type domain-containing protein n=1 Tax=Buddleja alternifolia TaxID=168488 RepID=A0AAV6XBD8_9LAMI|nr:hypothetical protein BUALT_Bualt06G0012600 [Buddleja alternifolia]